MPTIRQNRSAFTLIELLVVIAIIAILAVVVVLTLNPAQLLAQSRDANRVNDIATLNTAVNLYVTDQANGTLSLGTGTTTYIDLPDSSSICANQGLPTSTYVYHCSTTANYRNASSTGWIPVPFNQITAGSPISVMPVDPANQTSSNLYYTYATQSGQYVLSAFMESAKYAKNMESTGGSDPALLQMGSGLSSMPVVGRGLIGYWPLDEGTGTTAYDSSVTGNNATWLSGSGYASGKVGPYAAQFTGTNFLRFAALSGIGAGNGDFSISMWIYNSSSSWGGPAQLGLLGDESYPTNGFRFGFLSPTYKLNMHASEDGGTLNFAVGSVLSLSTWYHIAFTYSSSAQIGTIYINGVATATGSGTVIPPTGTGNIGSMGGYSSWVGYIDDVRVYNRALSANEIQEIYNAEK